MNSTFVLERPTNATDSSLSYQRIYFHVVALMIIAKKYIVDEFLCELQKDLFFWMIVNAWGIPRSVQEDPFGALSVDVAMSWDPGMSQSSIVHPVGMVWNSLRLLSCMHGTPLIIPSAKLGEWRPQCVYLCLRRSAGPLIKRQGMLQEGIVFFLVIKMYSLHINSSTIVLLLSICVSTWSRPFIFYNQKPTFLSLNICNSRLINLQNPSTEETLLQIPLHKVDLKCNLEQHYV